VEDQLRNQVWVWVFVCDQLIPCDHSWKMSCRTRFGF
jgi:hypothetical protein